MYVVGALAALAAVALATGVLFGWRYASSGTAPAPTVRFEVLPPAGVTLRPSPVASAAQLALSPDGRHLAFVAATKGGPSQIWIRPLDSVQAQPLAGTEGASFPFWSHDGRFIAFFAAGKLKRVDTRGGTPQTLADAAGWSRRDLEPGRRDPVRSPGDQSDLQNLCFGRDRHTGHDVRSRPGGPHAVLASVSAGRPPFPLLPAQREGRAPGHLRDVARLLAEHAGPRNRVARAVYASGHLLFVRDGMLFAQAFDDRALRTSGEPIRVADGVGYWAGAFAYTAVTASSAGVAGSRPERGVHDQPSLARSRRGDDWRPPAARAYRSPRLSPDQTSVMVAINDATTAQPDLWLLALARGTISRVTSDPSSDWFPVWSHDGSRVFFGSARMGSTTIFQKAGVSPEDRVRGQCAGGECRDLPQRRVTGRTIPACISSPPVVATISA